MLVIYDQVQRLGVWFPYHQFVDGVIVGDVLRVAVRPRRRGQGKCRARSTPVRAGTFCLLSSVEVGLPKALGFPIPRCSLAWSWSLAAAAGEAGFFLYSEQDEGFIIFHLGSHQKTILGKSPSLLPVVVVHRYYGIGVRNGVHATDEILPAYGTEFALGCPALCFNDSNRDGFSPADTSRTMMVSLLKLCC